MNKKTKALEKLERVDEELPPGEKNDDKDTIKKKDRRNI